MLMSKSRLEKFLYALYSLDSRDLPNPLSRIEELYKCWVTGEEVPTFEPISRTEKYLMAILGVYDVDSLPNPLSRVEVLLYKLATGDDNLDDVKSFLSEHEELLAEIIRNGGVGGNIDIEYVLHTLSTGYNILYNTAEKPVKSAILKGKTLVNLHKLENYSVYGVVLDGGINQHFGNDTLYSTWRMFDISMLKPNTEYGVFCWVLENTISEKYWDGHYYHSADTVFNPSTELRFSAGEMGLKFAKLTTISDFTGKTCGMRHLINANTPSSEYVKFRCVIVEYQEGMENWGIPYFEGMQSVKMPVLTTTGKNLFDGELKMGTIFSNGTTGVTEDCLRSSNYIKLEQNIDYMISNDKGYAHVIFGYNSNKEFVELMGSYSGNGVFKLTGNIEYIMFRSSGSLKQNDLSVKYQIEKGTVATPFEHHKSNILTVNEDVTLRSNGDVYDELNLLTCRLTQRIDENNEVLAQEVVKTVDLSVVNQDGNDTKLSTFDDITHVILSSEGLIPEAELEVATKNGEVLSTLSLEMDDISTSQNTLEETANIQSENVDATMIATTEIYEGLL